MNLKAIIPSGQTEIMVNGLHQWDYGRKLEIQSKDLPSLIEVHFACPGMQEAVVRSCAVTNGVATAAIPDACLEQTAPIIAWVYEVGSTSGTTVKTITLPIIARTRPQPTATVPTEASDKYTEAISAMNEAVDSAISAMDKALDSASKGEFTTARAISDADGNNIPDTYATKNKVNGTALSSNILDYGLSLVGDGTSYKIVQKYILIPAENWTTAADFGLPHSMARYGYVTFFVRAKELRVIAWCADSCSIHYNSHNGNKWSGWCELIDSNNIDNYRKPTPVNVKLIMNNQESDTADAFYNVVYYQDGARKSLNDGVSAGYGSTKTHNLTVDLGSYLSVSANSEPNWSEVDTPFITKASNQAEGSFPYKRCVIVVGGGTAEIKISGEV